MYQIVKSFSRKIGEDDDGNPITEMICKDVYPETNRIIEMPADEAKQYVDAGYLQEVEEA